MPLKTRAGFPPNGWQYKQRETGWIAPYPLVDNFERTVQRIIEHRRLNARLNLSIDPDVVSSELDEYTCRRLNYHENYCSGDDLKKKSLGDLPSRAIQPSPRRNVAVAARRIGSGVQVLRDWLGDGLRPVPSGLSQERANICETCPHNTAGGFVASYITKPIAQAIKAQMLKKNEMAISVTNEDKLNTCNVCLCTLPLKVHVPIEYLEETTDEETFNEFPDFCWVKKELSAKKVTA